MKSIEAPNMVNLLRTGCGTVDSPDEMPADLPEANESDVEQEWFHQLIISKPWTNHMYFMIATYSPYFSYGEDTIQG